MLEIIVLSIFVVMILVIVSVTKRNTAKQQREELMRQILVEQRNIVNSFLNIYKKTFPKGYLPVITKHRLNLLKDEVLLAMSYCIFINKETVLTSSVILYRLAAVHPTTRISLIPWNIIP